MGFRYEKKCSADDYILLQCKEMFISTKIYTNIITYINVIYIIQLSDLSIQFCSRFCISRLLIYLKIRGFSGDFVIFFLREWVVAPYLFRRTNSSALVSPDLTFRRVQVPSIPQSWSGCQDTPPRRWESELGRRGYATLSCYVVRCACTTPLYPKAQNMLYYFSLRETYKTVPLN